MARIEDLFVASYIHLQAILSLLEVVIQGKRADFPHNVARVLFLKKPSEKPEDDATYLMPTLFCLALARGEFAYPAFEGIMFP